MYKCGKDKPTSDFHKRKLSKDGLQNACKECRLSPNIKTRMDLLEHKIYYKINRSKLLEQKKILKKSNKILNKKSWFYLHLIQV